MSASVLTATPVVPEPARAEADASHQAAQVTYERIAGAIAAVTVRGAQVRVHWKNPFTGTPMGESTATMAADRSLAARTQARVRRSPVQEALEAIVRVIEGVARGFSRRVGRDARNTASSDQRVRAGMVYTDASCREAVVRAFAAVRHAFTWDERSGRFIAR